MAGSHQVPGEWPVLASRGDTLEVVTWTLTRNATPWTPTGATAVVRQNESRNSGTVVELTAAPTTGGVEAFGDRLDVPAGRYWWELTVTDTNIAADYRRTLLAGEFVVADDDSPIP
jgi:hypothetical protein